jgi:hypothetical protein
MLENVDMGATNVAIIGGLACVCEYLCTMRDLFVKLLFSLILFQLLSYQINAQGNSKGQVPDSIVQSESEAITRPPASLLYNVAPSAKIKVSEIEDPWLFGIKSFGDTIIGNRQYGEGMKALKAEVSRRYPRRESRSVSSSLRFSTDTPSVLRNFQGNLNSGIPNDNTMAISNGNRLISAINTTIYFYNVDSLKLQKATSLNNFSSSLTYASSHRYDPKLIYDPEEDKFILVFLAGASSDTKTHIILGFSESNDPLGNWFLYTLPGNPLPGDTSWTDYPAIALSKDEFFVTGNLLRYGGTWQESFKQSVIWQMDKKAGFRGDSLDARLYFNIHHEGKPVRNIHPVQGGDHLYGPDMYFLSNRNFALQNDTVFLIHVSGLRNDPKTRLSLRPLISDQSYGAPPLARQANNHTFETNDARVLGAFYQNNKIQFVGNTVDTGNGFAAVFHGTIRFPERAERVQGNILSDSIMDYGYPKITYTGTSPWDDQAIISFNHSSPVDYAGMSAIFYLGNGDYSITKVVHKGNDYVNVMSGLGERWGDYTGSQRKYNEPGVIWVSGYHGAKSNVQRVNQTWIAELRAPGYQAPKPSENITALTYPNPAFDDIVSLELFLPEAGMLRVSVYDMAGRRLALLHEAEEAAGLHLITFSKAGLSKGIYLIHMEHGGKEMLTSKLIVP